MAGTATAHDLRVSFQTGQNGVVRLFVATASAFLLLACITDALNGAAQLSAHLQVFGFAGTLALGVGFAWLSSRGGDTIRRDGAPGSRVQRASLVTFAAQATLLMWTAGGITRVLPHGHTASSVLEFAAFLLFSYSLVRGGALRSLAGRTVPACIAAAALLLLGLTLALGFLPDVDGRFLLLACWGFMAPLAWAAGAQWLTNLLGLKPQKNKILIAACVLNLVGVAGALAGKIHFAAVLLLHAAIFIPSSLKVFGRSQRQPHIKHAAFVRVAYGWLRLAATVGVWASVHDATPLWSASRHALTVGFVVLLVLATVDWWLPRLTAIAPVFPVRLTRTALAAVTLGCALYIAGRIASHLGHTSGFWITMLGAFLESAAVLAIAVSIALSVIRVPAEPDLMPEPEL